MFKLNGVRFDDREVAVLRNLCEAYYGQTKGDVRRFRPDSGLSGDEWTRFESKLFDANFNDNRTSSWFNVKINSILDALERLPKAAPTKPMEEVVQSEILVFISHSSRDEPLAKALAQLIQSALAIPHAAIRCTSVNGYKLQAGADVIHQLRDEVVQAETLVALVTDVSIESAFVLFEMGARWGVKKFFAPVLGAGATSVQLKGPLGGLNALSCTDNDIHQLLGDLAEKLNREVANPSAYGESLTNVVVQSKKLADTRVQQPHTVDETETVDQQSLSPVAHLLLFLTQLDPSGQLLVTEDDGGAYFQASNHSFQCSDARLAAQFRSGISELTKSHLMENRSATVFAYTETGSKHEPHLDCGLLFAASVGRQHFITVSKDMSNTDYIFGELQFRASAAVSLIPETNSGLILVNQREEAMLLDAVKTMVESGWIEEADRHSYKITKKGYAIVD